jgi:very-short-patch-repair endonuclease
MRTEATEAEARLWFLLRDGRLDELKFRRQVPIGNAIVDSRVLNDT